MAAGRSSTRKRRCARWHAAKKRKSWKEKQEIDGRPIPHLRWMGGAQTQFLAYAKKDTGSE